MSEQNHRLPYPITFQVPTEAVPWVGRKTFLQSGFNLLKLKDGHRIIEIGLPKDAWQLSMESISTVLFGTFFDDVGQMICTFTIDGEGSVTYIEG